MNYLEKAHRDARECAREFTDTILDALADAGAASDDLLNDYPDGDAYHHENHVDKEYSLSEADDLLSELSDYEEGDSGLWQGLPPRQAISAQAAYTYGNAVYAQWRQLIWAINDEHDDEESDLGTAVRRLVEARKEDTSPINPPDLRRLAEYLDEPHRSTAVRIMDGNRTTPDVLLVLADVFEEAGEDESADECRKSVAHISARERAEQALTEFVRAWN